MSKREDEVLVAQWLRRPLCRQYMAGIIQSIPIRCSTAGGTHDSIVYWVLGCLPDGDSEILGAWVQAWVARAPLDDVLADLHLRGVEVIRVLIACIDGPATEPARAAQHGCSGVQCERILPQEAHERAVLCTERVVQEIQLQLCKAIMRQGSFGGEAEGLKFVAKFLFRADRQHHQASSAGRIRHAGRVVLGMPAVPLSGVGPLRAYEARQ